MNFLLKFYIFKNSEFKLWFTFDSLTNTTNQNSIKYSVGISYFTNIQVQNVIKALHCRLYIMLNGCNISVKKYPQNLIP